MCLWEGSEIKLLIKNLGARGRGGRGGGVLIKRSGGGCVLILFLDRGEGS